MVAGKIGDRDLAEIDMGRKIGRQGRGARYRLLEKEKGPVEVRLILGVVPDPRRDRPAPANRLTPGGFERVGVDPPVIVKEAVIEMQGRVPVGKILDEARVPGPLIARIGPLLEHGTDIRGQQRRYAGDTEVERLLRGVNEQELYYFIGIFQKPRTAGIAEAGLDERVLVEDLSQA